MGVTSLMTVREFIEAIQANAPDDAKVFVACESAPGAHPICAVSLGGDAEGKALIIMSEPGFMRYMEAQAIGFPYVLDRDISGTDDSADTAPADTECPPDNDSPILTNDDNERLDDFADFLNGLDN